MRRKALSAIQARSVRYLVIYNVFASGSETKRVVVLIFTIDTLHFSDPVPMQVNFT